MSFVLGFIAGMGFCVALIYLANRAFTSGKMGGFW
jgi:hypothetical protein